MAIGFGAVALNGMEPGLEGVNRLQGFQQYSLSLTVLASANIGISYPHPLLYYLATLEKSQVFNNCNNVSKPMLTSYAAYRPLIRRV